MMPKLRSLIPLLAVFCLSVCLLTSQAVARNLVQFSTFEEVNHFFEQNGYSREAWEAGIRVIPPFFLTRIPAGKHEHYAREIPVIEKKELFFRLLAPEILLASQRIEAERKVVAASTTDAPRLLAIALKYKVVTEDASTMNQEALAELKLRVDTLPLSMVLAQAADESGWGTSRFAKEGNALFGQWTWNEKGIQSEMHQNGKGHYKVASFASPAASIEAYMLNLNTNFRYAPLRKTRADIRKDGRTPTGIELVTYLTPYSQRGEGYVKDIHAIIETNNLAHLDTAVLSTANPVDLAPLPADRKK